MIDTEDATVLVVDDEPKWIELTKSYLNGEYTVRTAMGGAEALRAVDETVDVVLLDRRMPGKPGDVVLDELRERDVGVQVAMLTAVEPDIGIADMPFDDYRVKPVSRTELLELVRSLIKRARYSERCQKLFELASKRAALQTAGEDDTTEYEQLTERLGEVREEIDTVFDDDVPKALFRELPGGKS